MTSPARHTIEPTGAPSVEPPKKLIVAHDVPKSPCSSRSMYLPYWTIAGLSVPSRWCACAICCGEECWMSIRKPAGSAGTFR